MHLLPAQGHSTDNAKQSCKLATAVIRVMLASMRSNLARKLMSSRSTTQNLTLPQWGVPAVRARAKLLKSGMLSRHHTAALVTQYPAQQLRHASNPLLQLLLCHFQANVTALLEVL